MEELFLKAFDLINDEVKNICNYDSLRDNTIIIRPGEYKKTIIDNIKVIIIGTSRANILINLVDHELFLFSKLISDNYKKPYLEFLLYNKLSLIIKEKTA